MTEASLGDRISLFFSDLLVSRDRKLTEAEKRRCDVGTKIDEGNEDNRRITHYEKDGKEYVVIDDEGPLVFNLVTLKMDWHPDYNEVRTYTDEGKLRLRRSRLTARNGTSHTTTVRYEPPGCRFGDFIL